MNNTEKVYDALKPKVASLGFTKKELESVAAVIADNLSLEEDAEEDVVNAAIEKAVNTMIPVLQVAQSQASRSIEKFKAANAKGQSRSADDDDTEPKSKEQDAPKANAVPDWAQSLLDSVSSLKLEVNGLKSEKLTSTRKAKLEAALKDTGAFGTQTMRSFAKMNFNDDNDFDEFLTEVKESVKDLQKERNDKALESLNKHPNGYSAAGQAKEVTDAEIDKIVASL